MGARITFRAPITVFCVLSINGNGCICLAGGSRDNRYQPCAALRYMSNFPLYPRYPSSRSRMSCRLSTAATCALP